MSQENLISIYKINTESKYFDNCNKNFETIIETIINRGNKKNETKRRKKREIKLNDYVLVKIKNIENYGFSIKLYHGERKNPNSWNAFLSKVLVENSDIALWNKNHDFIVFVYNDIDMFCFTGGIACNLVSDICDDNFPRELMIRISDPEKIKQAKNRSLTGSFYAKDLYFRGDYNISPSEAFGSIWKDVRASVRDGIKEDPDWQSILGNKITRDLNCDIKNSFKIRRRVDFQTSIRLIKKLKNELERDLTDEEKLNFNFLNTIKIVKNKNDKADLNRKLIEKAFEYLTSKKSEVFDYDFCHKNYSNFFEANKYIAKRGKNELCDWQEIANAQQVLDYLKSDFDLSDIDCFIEDFEKNIKIISEHEEDSSLNTHGSILNHLHGELVIKNKTYFLIDKEWCFIEDDFLKSLSNDFNNYIDSDIFCNKLFLNNWSNGSEGQYNESHLIKDSFLVSDRIILNGIELFDLLYIDENDLYIIHVKDGFGASVRDACSQLRNSSKLIEESIKDIDHKKIKEFYKKLHNCKVNYTKKKDFKKQLNSIGTELNFVNKFINSKRHYVLAFRHGVNKNDIIKTKSNIAKFELLGLKQDMNILGSDLNLYQILK